MTSVPAKDVPVLPRLEQAVTDRLGAIVALLGDHQNAVDLTADIAACGAALARLARERQRRGDVVSAVRSASTWVREQRVITVPDADGYVLVPAGARGRVHASKQLREFTYCGIRLSDALVRSVRRALVDAPWAEFEPNAMVPLDRLAEHHGLSESQLREFLRTRSGRRGLAWPLYYGDGVWQIPRRVLTDEATRATRQQHGEPPHLAPLPPGYEPPEAVVGALRE